MKQTAGLPTRLISFLLVAALTISLLPGLGIVTAAAGTASGDTYVYIPVKDLSNASGYEGTTIVSNFMDTYLGGSAACGNETLLLQSPGDLVEYDIDLDDGVTQAVLKVSAKHAEVSVKASGGSFVTLTATNGAAADRGVNLFDLTQADALASADNKFTVRIGYKDQAVVLNALAVVAEQPQWKGEFVLNPLGESYLQSVADVSAGATRYFLNETIPTIYLHTNEYVTLYLDFADDVEGLRYGYANAGNALTAEVSTDGTVWTALPAAGGNLEDTVPLPADKAVYLRFTAAAGDAFLHTVTVTPSYAAIDAGRELYLPLNSLSAASQYGGTGLAENFNDTYLGGSDVTNPTLLLQQDGDYVEYSFDMADDVTEARLKILITGGQVEARAEGGEYVTLTPENGSGFDRGLAIFKLDETNALSHETRRFTLRIRYAGSTVVLQSLLLQAQETELSDTYTLDPLGESYLRYVADVSAGASRYFLDGTKPTVFLHSGEKVVFRFNFTDEAEGVRFAYQQAGNALKAEVSADGSAWYEIPSGGQVEDAITLPRDRAFLLRFTAENGDAFLSGMALTAVFGAVEEKEDVFLPIRDLSNADRYGGGSIVENFADTYLGGSAEKVSNPTLLLQNAGDYVEYDINLPDGVDSAELKIYMLGGAVSVKPKGGSYVNLTAVNGQHFDRNVAIYHLTTEDALASEERQFTVRIACDGSGAVVLNGLLVTTGRSELTGGYELDVLGESYLRSVVMISGGATRYFLNEQEPTVYLHTGESVTLFFDFADDVRSLTYSYGNMGQPLTARISTDGENWVALPAGGRIEDALALNADRSFFLRFTAEAGDSFLNALTITPAEPVEIPEADYVYIPIRDLGGVSGYGGNGIVENFLDTFSGGEDDKVSNMTLLLQNPGDYVEYTFNLSDARTGAVLKVYMTDAVVSVKPEGGEYITLTARNERGLGFNRGVAVYDLTTANALAHESRRFTVRISCNGSATAVLNGLVVDAANAPLSGGSYTLDPLGESFLRGLWDLSQDTTRYFHEGSIPTVHIKNGGYVTFRLNFEAGGACYPVTYTTLGAEVTAEVSLDGTKWVALKGERVDKALNMAGTGTYYLRFTANGGESFLLALNASRETSAPPEAINTNPNLPKDETYVYFRPGTAEEEKYMFGLGEDWKAYFEQTNDGMDRDGFEGGYSDTLPPNARLFHGKYVTYEFDLRDSISQAELKIYGLGDMTFLVSTDNGETYDTLTPRYAPTGNGRGYYIFDLNEANALAGTDNRFRLQIKGTFGILLGLMIETETPEIRDGVHFEIQNEAGLRYLYQTGGLRTYYADAAFANYYLDEAGYVIYEVPFAPDIRDAVLYATYSGDVRMEVATERDGTYETLLISALGASGTPHTNTFDLSGYLARSSTLYIRVTGSAAGGFLDSMGISVMPSDEAEGGFSVFDETEARYLYSILANGQGIGTAKRVTVDLTKARGIDVGGAVIYRINLPDDAGGVDLFADAVGRYELTVSIDGVNFVSVVELGREGDGLRAIEPLPDSGDKVLYVKIRNLSDTDVLVLKGLTFSTRDVPAYERPVTPDFGYDTDQPGTFPTDPGLTEPTEPEAIPVAPQEEEPSLLWVWITAGAVLAVLILVVILLAVRKKKNRKA